jgi:MscS family membrane protein
MRKLILLLAISPLVAVASSTVRAYLPELFMAMGPGGLAWWQWVAVPGVVAISGAAGMVLGFATRAVLSRLAARTTTTWDDHILERLDGPLSVAWGLLAGFITVRLLDLPVVARDGMIAALRIALLVDLFWAFLRGIDVGGRFVLTTPWATVNPSSRALLPLAVRVSKVLVVAAGAVTIFAELGYPVASLVAGLGIGGLAFALAGQKTIENLFGAFSIGFDQPIREGDFVKIEDFVGTVEAIGLRSTRVRTLDRTIITIPNGRLADMRLESFAVRDRMRLACTVGLVYATSADQVRAVLAGLERVLREHPKIWPDAVVVKFKEFASSSLDIEIMAWFQTRDWGEFQGIRQEILLSFMEVVESAGTSFAFPTRTLHIEGGGRPPEELVGGARRARSGDARV